MRSNLIFSNIKDNQIDITFVIPTFKRAKYLEKSIESIIHLDNLRSINYEILIINNDPSDTMMEFVNKYGSYSLSIYVNEDNYGMIGNINQGAKLAKGKYISFLHDDDYLLPHYLRCICNKLNLGYDCLIPGRYLLSDEKRKDKKRQLLNLVYFFRYIYRSKIGDIKYKNCLYASKNIYLAPSCGTLFLKKSLEAFGYFKDEHGFAWDYYNFREFNKKYRVGIIRDYISVYRIGSGVSNKPLTRLDFFEDQISIIEQNKKTCKFISFFSKEIEYQYSKLLDEYEVIKYSKLKYLLYLFLTNSYYYGKNLDITKTIKKDSGSRWIK